jgi:RNA polymerase sigma-70 factor (ECF subfamily)
MLALATGMPLPEARVTLAPADARLVGELYRAHASAIFRALRRWGVPDGRADDALQETFLVAARRLGTFEGRSSHLTWLFGIALRVARGVRRQRTHDELLAEPEDVGPGLEERTDARRAAIRLDALLAQLDDDQREVFVLAELEERTAPEIAEITGAKLNTVYSRLRLARQAVQAAFARDGGEP